MDSHNTTTQAAPGTATGTGCKPPETGVFVYASEVCMVSVTELRRQLAIQHAFTLLRREGFRV